jgi:cyclic pyranopterin phosphate synthase
MPEHVEFLPRDQLLSFEEIERVVRVAVTIGIDKVRLTGGEPLVRRELPRLVEKLATIPGLSDIGLTTNGVLLAPLVKPLWNAGLRRINISLDAMSPARFRELTRRDDLDRVLEGILAAREAGFNPVKINAVAIRGQTEHEVVPLARFARAHGLEMRFIEYMPLDAGHLWEREKVLFAADIIELLEREIGPLIPVPDPDPRAPAVDYDYEDGGGRVGIIASVTRPFCMSCNRLRLTAEGKLRNCLFALEESDLRPLLRSGADDAAIARVMRDCVASKWEGHEINTARFIQPERLMHSIGG